METLSHLLNFFFDTLADWPAGTFFGVFVGGLGIVSCLFITLLAGIGTFRILDSWFQPIKKAIGVVKGKKFTPVDPFDPFFRDCPPHHVDHWNCWTLIVEIDGKQNSIDVAKDFFGNTAKGSQVTVDYVTGRLSGDLYLREIYG